MGGEGERVAAVPSLPLESSLNSDPVVAVAVLQLTEPVAVGRKRLSLPASENTHPLTSPQPRGCLPPEPRDTRRKASPLSHAGSVHAGWTEMCGG